MLDSWRSVVGIECGREADAMHTGQRNISGWALVGVGSIALLWVVTRSAAAGPAPERQSSGFAVSAPFDVPVPPRLAAQLGEVLRRPPVNRSAARPQQGSPVRLTYQTFEESAFPPPGWQLLDTLSEGTEQYVWGRETCDLAPNGGTGAVWAMGGGALGSQLPCVSAYTAPVDSWLIYGPINASEFHSGLQVNLRVKLDQPSAGGLEMQLCATEGPLITGMRCVSLTPAKLDWGGPASPILLDWTAENGRVAFALRYVDRQPKGGVFGALADNVLIEGVPGVPPTITPTDTASPTPTVTPSRTPTATVEPIGVVRLPILWGGNGKGVRVDFGVEVDEQGRLVQPGSVFQYGIPSLCARIAWREQAPGTTLHWQWYRDGRSLAGLSGDLVDIAAEGADNSCISGGDGPDGQPLPMPLGRFEVKVLRNGGSEAIATGQALIQPDPPPGATAIPSGTPPTEEPTATEPPTDTPTPEPGVTCSDYLRNGNFESGAQLWSAFDNLEPVSTGSIIVRYSDVSPAPPAHDGQWLSLFGGRLSVDQELRQTWAHGGALIPEDELISATLQLSYLINTDERPDGTIDDYVVPALARPNSPSVTTLMTSISEELLSTGVTEGKWVRSEPIDVWRFMVKRPGWDTARFVFVARNGPERKSLFLVDQVSLIVCTRPAIPHRQ